MICPKCREEVKPSDEKFILGVDRPYMNISFHRKCYRDIEDIYRFMGDNALFIYDLYYPKNRR